jgi:hypothetical protein
MSAPEGAIADQAGSLDAAAPRHPGIFHRADQHADCALADRTMVLTASIVRLFNEPGLRPAPSLRPPRGILISSRFD